MIPAVFELGGPDGSDPPSVPWLDGEKTLVISLGSAGYASRADLAVMRSAFPHAIHLGASTARAYCGNAPLRRGLACAAMHFESSVLRKARVKVLRPEQSHQAGVELGSKLDHPELKAVFLFADGRALRSASFLRGLGASLPDGTVIVGGLAAEADDGTATWVFDSEGMHTSCVVAVGIYGPHAVVRGAVSKGWQRFGPRRCVTRASGSLVYELDCRPVVKLYEEYLGVAGADMLKFAPRMPLGLHDPQRDGVVTVRSVQGMDERGIALSFSGEVPQGAEVQLLRARKNGLIEGAGRAAERLARGMRRKRSSCVIALGQRGRHMVLGLRAPEEFEAVRAALPGDVPMVGAISGGALLARVGGEGELYGESFTLFEVSES